MSLKSDYAIAVKTQPVPAGWRTCQQIAKEEGLSVSHTGRMLRDVVQAGTWESKTWKTDTHVGARRTIIYREKKK